MKYTELAGPIGVRARFQALAERYDGKSWYSADDLAKLWDIDKVTAAQAAAYMVKKGWLSRTIETTKEKGVQRFRPMLDVKEKPRGKSTPLRIERFNKYGKDLLGNIRDSGLGIGHFTNSQLLEMSSVRRYSYGYRAAIISAVLIEATNRGLLVKEVYGYRLPKPGE